MEKRYNSNENEEVKDELIEVLMNYLKEVTDTEHPACEAAAESLAIVMSFAKFRDLSAASDSFIKNLLS